jgi:hypothetical protein
MRDVGAGQENIIANMIFHNRKKLITFGMRNHEAAGRETIADLEANVDARPTESRTSISISFGFLHEIFAVCSRPSPGRAVISPRAPGSRPRTAAPGQASGK